MKELHAKRVIGIIGTVILVIFILIVSYVFVSRFGDIMKNPHKIREIIVGYGVWGYLVFSLFNIFQIIFGYEFLEYRGLWPYEETPDIRWADLQTGDVPVIVDMGNPLGKIHIIKGVDETSFQILHNPFLKHGNLEDVILFQYLLGDP